MGYSFAMCIHKSKKRRCKKCAENRRREALYYKWKPSKKDIWIDKDAQKEFYIKQANYEIEKLKNEDYPNDRWLSGKDRAKYYDRLALRLPIWKTQSGLSKRRRAKSKRANTKDGVIQDIPVKRDLQKVQNPRRFYSSTRDKRGGLTDNGISGSELAQMPLDL